MRRVALVPRFNPQDVKRVILHEADDGVYLYLLRSIHDAGSFADEWYASVEDAEAICESFGIDKGMWQEVPDAEPGCQDDWIAPVRIKGREQGRPHWEVLERLVGGHWVQITERRGAARVRPFDPD
jgi:hypothetical protein